MSEQRAAPEEEQTTPAADAAGAAEAEAAVEEDLDQLAQAQRERDEYLELAQRTRADFDNYRKRVAGEAQAAAVRGRAELAKELIPVLDSLEQAIENADGNDPLAKGIKLVLTQLNELLGRAGIESYDPTGQAFDPNLHEAVSTMETASVADGTVLETLARGYSLDGQVLRPARVVVSK